MSSATAETHSPESSENAWKTACLKDDLVPDSGVCVLFENTQIAIFYLRKNDSIFAIGNYDPFSNVNVLSRGIVGSLSGKLVVASPIYKQHFCLETGICLEDETVSVQTYPIRIVDNQVQLKIVT